ncbi:MAG: adenylate/guanylate cyclase domain-containing protein [Acidimicrobiia bacterium]|nr:MAG: adenylate/guanylate cyclase domain-containing protein [Acidimicrobiia bacterium]
MGLLQNPPRTKYVDTGDGYVAYQTFGDGPRDLLFCSGLNSNIDVMWQLPAAAHFFDRLASFSRVILHDSRGTGVSDPLPLASLATFDVWLDDMRAVVDAAGVDDAAVIGDVEGGANAMLFAATHPERVSALVLLNSYARWHRADDFPIGMPESASPKMLAWLEAHHGQPDYFAATAPSIAGDAKLNDWLARYTRLAATPNTAKTVFQWWRQIDLRPVLGNINVPTLVIARHDATYHRPEHGRYLAEHIPNARLVELPGADTAPFFVADPEPVLDEIEQFLTGTRSRPVSDRTLTTVMFTDIVDSTGHAARLGDQQWLQLLGDHDRITRDLLDQYRGREVDTAGDGFLATFDGPTRAVTCAAELRQSMGDLGIDIRSGLHTGEIEINGEDIGGLAVHIAARVTDAAPDNGVMVSSTVKDLVVGSGIEFEDRGPHQLKGVPGEWRLYAVTGLP